MGFLRQEYWSGLLFPIPRDLPDLGNEPKPAFPVLAGGSFTTAPWGQPGEWIKDLYVKFPFRNTIEKEKAH